MLPRRCPPLALCSLLLVAAAVSTSAAWCTDRLVPSQYGTIQAAVNAAVSGDKVIVSPGTYTEAVTISGKTIYLWNTDPDDPAIAAQTTIRCPDAGTAAVTSSNSSTSMAVFTQLAGFTIRGPHNGVVTGAGVHFFNNCYINDNSGTGVTANGGEMHLRYCEVKRNVDGVLADGCNAEVGHSTVAGNTHMGVQYTNADESSLVYGSEVYENGSHGVLLDAGWVGESSIYDNGAVGVAAGAGVGISNNRICGNEIGITLQLYAGGTAEVKHNRVYGNHSSIAASKGGGLYCAAYGGANVTVAFNTFDDNQSPNGGGIYCTVADGSSLTISNCLITNNSGYGIYRSGTTGTVSVSYCDVWNSSLKNYNGISSNAGLGNLSVDPLYSARVPQELRLQSMAGHYEFGGTWYLDSQNSPCIDAGDPAHDYSNEVSPNGNRVNMGWDGASSMASKTPDWPVIVTRTPVGTGADARATVTVGFSRAMNTAATQAAFSLTPAVAGTFSWVGNEMRFKPKVVLPALTTYTVKVTTGATSAGGIHMPLPRSWTFKTSGSPVVSGRYPTGSTVSPLTKVKVTFNSPMDRASAVSAFSMTPAVAGRFSWNVNQMILTPNTPLAPAQSYRVTISTAARSAAGVAMAAEYYWVFKTASLAPAPISVAAAPAGPGAHVTVSLSAAAAVTLRIENLAGREVALLTPGTLPAGTQTLAWNGRSRDGLRVPAGCYLVRAEARTAGGDTTSAVTRLWLR